MFQKIKNLGTQIKAALNGNQTPAQPPKPATSTTTPQNNATSTIQPTPTPPVINQPPPAPSTPVKPPQPVQAAPTNNPAPVEAKKETPKKESPTPPSPEAKKKQGYCSRLFQAFKNFCGSIGNFFKTIFCYCGKKAS